MKTRALLLFPVFFLCIAAAFAQPPETLWTQHYGGSSSDFAYDCQPTPDGGFVIVGSTRSFNLPYDYTYLVKTDSLGDTLWTGAYHPGEWHRASYGKAVHTTPDGGYIIVGNAYNWVSFTDDMTILKTDSLGQMQWNQTYGHYSADDGAHGVLPTGDGGYIIVGTIHLWTNHSDVWIIKTDRIGMEEWSRTYGGGSGEQGWAIARVPEGGYIAAGQSSSFGNGRSEAYLIRINEVGDTLWTRTYGWEDMHVIAHSVQVLPDEGYIMAGKASGQDVGYEIVVIRTDSQGDTLWTRVFGEAENDEYANCVQSTSDGGFVLCGTQVRRHNCETRFSVMKLDSEGYFLWSQAYSSRRSEAFTVHQLADGGYAAAGYTSTSQQSYEMYLVRLGADTNNYRQSDQAYGGAGYDWCNSIQQTPDGGCLLGGYTNSFGAGGFDLWVVKTDADGDSLWSRTFGGENEESCHAVCQTTNGSFVLGGCTTSFGAGDRDFWLVKMGADGDSLWSCTYGGSNQDVCTSVLQTTGGYVLAGYTHSFGAGGYDFWLVKTDAYGNRLWARTFGESHDERCLSVQQTSDGGYALAGFTNSSGAGDYDFWLVKTDANSDFMWSRTYGGSGSDYCYSVQQTTDGGYVLGGCTNSFGAGDYDFWLVKTDEDGYIMWSRASGGSASDWCYSVQQTAEGGYMLAGYTGSYGAGEEDFWLLKTNANGDSIWSRTFGGAYNDRCRSFRQTADGSCVLAGVSESFGAGDYDFWFVKIEPVLTPVWERRLSSPQQFNLSVYPNPFNPTTNISFDLPKAMQAQLNIFDIMGRLVTTLADEQFSIGTHSLRFNGSAYPSGIYFARLQAEHFNQTRKLILLK